MKKKILHFLFLSILTVCQNIGKSQIKLIPETQFGAEYNPTGNPIGGGKGYSDYPSGGYVTVTTAAELVTAINQNNYSGGMQIFIPANVTIDFTNQPKPGVITKKITIFSDRGQNNSPGALIKVDPISPPESVYLFNIQSNDVRITGLRIQGPYSEIDEDRVFPECAAILSSGNNLEVDNCEIFNWNLTGIWVQNIIIQDYYDVYIHHNYIHHCQRWGDGYGVDVDQYTFAMIEANIFDYCRHAIAGTGRYKCSYTARYNIFLKNIYHYPIDMHVFKSTHSDSFDNQGDDYAGDWIKVYHNSIYANNIGNITNPKHTGFSIEGVSRYGTYIFNNWFISTQINAPQLTHDENSINQRHYINDKTYDYFYDFNLLSHYQQNLNWIRMIAFENRFKPSFWGSDTLDCIMDSNVVGNTWTQAALKSRYRTADFNGDGLLDIIYFHTNGKMYINLGTKMGFEHYESNFGSTPVEPLMWDLWGQNGADIGMDRYKIGDMNGDGKSDVVSFESNFNIYVWFSTGVNFDLHHWGKNGGDIGGNRYKIGDMTGDGKTDVVSFESNGNIYVWVSTGFVADNVGNPHHWGTNGQITPNRYKLGDVNGDGKMDVLSFEPNTNIYAWISNGNGFVNGPYGQFWGCNGDDLGGNKYKVGDKNGDPYNDVISFESYDRLFYWLSTSSGFPSSCDGILWVSPNDGIVNLKKSTTTDVALESAINSHSASCSSVEVNFFNDEANSYKILYKQLNESVFQNISVPGDQFSYTVTGLDEWEDYIFYVEAINSAGSVLSSPVTRYSCKDIIVAIPVPAIDKVRFIIKKESGKISSVELRKIDNPGIGKEIIVSPPKKEVEIPIHDLPAGYYGVKILDSKNIQHSEMILKQ